MKSSVQRRISWCLHAVMCFLTARGMSKWMVPHWSLTLKPAQSMLDFGSQTQNNLKHDAHSL
jgi:hypothetical protein